MAWQKVVYEFDVDGNLNCCYTNAEQASEVKGVSVDVINGRIKRKSFVDGVYLVRGRDITYDNDEVKSLCKKIYFNYGDRGKVRRKFIDALGTGVMPCLLMKMMNINGRHRVVLLAEYDIIEQMKCKTDAELEIICKAYQDMKDADAVGDCPCEQWYDKLFYGISPEDRLFSAVLNVSYAEMMRLRLDRWIRLKYKDGEPSAWCVRVL